MPLHSRTVVCMCLVMSINRTSGRRFSYDVTETKLEIYVYVVLSHISFARDRKILLNICSKQSSVYCIPTKLRESRRA